MAEGRNTHGHRRMPETMGAFFSGLLVVNELVLGQRPPSRPYFCRRCPGSMMELQYVHCPRCGVFHDAMIWSKSHAFGHWLGLICPDCGCQIPSLLNVISWPIPARISPVCWLLWCRFGKQYQAFEQERAFKARMDDQFAFVDQLAAGKDAMIDTTPTHPKLPTGPIEGAAREIPGILANVQPHQDGTIELVASLCRDSGELVVALKLLTGEDSPHDLYGRRLDGEEDCDDD